eukprot:gene3788-4311_t
MSLVSRLGHGTRIIWQHHTPLNYLKENSGVKICLLLLNRPLEKYLSILKNIWNSALIKVCADGALNRLNDALGTDEDRYIPDYVCGDFDSVCPNLLELYEKRGANIVETTSQDETDFTKTLYLAIEKLQQRRQEYDAIVCLGGFGGRMDHVMSNLNCLYKASKIQSKPCYLVSSKNLMCLLQPGSHVLHVNTGFEDDWCGLIPLGCLVQKVYTTGLKWNLVELPRPPFYKRCLKNADEDLKPKLKQILFDVNGSIEPGSHIVRKVLACGVGKTTLMNVLAHQNLGPLLISGSIKVNGQEIGKKMKTISAYVQQEDLYIGTLTVREHLYFQAMLRIDRSVPRSEKLARADKVIYELGLTKCQDTLIGIPGRIRGISGGELKRLFFASEVLTNPALLFVDEPTSGLDSFMAQNVIGALQKMAAGGRTILTTIHQPSSEVYNMFDKVLFMSEGRVAYIALGYPCPPNYNPADHFIGTLAIIPGNEVECKERSKAICDAFEDYSSILFRETRFYSGHRTHLRHDNNQDSIQNYTGAVFFCVTTSSINSLCAAVFTFPAELPVFLKEHKLGMYRTDAYFFAKMLAENHHCLSVIISNIYSIASMEYNWAIFIFYYRLLDDWFECNCETIFHFCWHHSPRQSECFFIWLFGFHIVFICSQVASALGPPMTMPFLLFGGFLLKDASIPVYFVWLKYLSWFKYSFEALLVNQWDSFGSIGCSNNFQPSLNSSIASRSLPCIPNGKAVLQFFSLEADIVSATSQKPKADLELL